MDKLNTSPSWCRIGFVHGMVQEPARNVKQKSCAAQCRAAWAQQAVQRRRQSPHLNELQSGHWSYVGQLTKGTPLISRHRPQPVLVNMVKPRSLQIAHPAIAIAIASLLRVPKVSGTTSGHQVNTFCSRAYVCSSSCSDHGTSCNHKEVVIQRAPSVREREPQQNNVLLVPRGAERLVEPRGLMHSSSASCSFLEGSCN